MGELYRHRCGECGYEAQVSGGDDRGFVAVTTTVACHDCEVLGDIPMGKWEPGREGVVDPQPLACPKDSAHRVEKWSSGDPCPRCSRPIRRGAVTLLWD